MAKVPKKASPKSSSSVDIDALDSSFDKTDPDASPGELAQHAEDLAVLVRVHLDRLSKGKITEEDCAKLKALAWELRKRESDWKPFAVRNKDEALINARENATAARKDLLSGLRTFCKDDVETVAELKDIGDVKDDADLQLDLTRLLKLAKKHKADLAGTDVDEEQVAIFRSFAKAFSEARSGETAEGGEPGKKNKDAKRALAYRNRVFWALGNLERTVCERAQHVFRNDEQHRKLFTIYTTALRHKSEKNKPAPTT